MSWNVTLSAFADEIAVDFAEQLEVLQAEGLDHLDLRTAWGTNVADLGDEQVERIRGLLAERKMQVACIGSPIGKTPVTEPFDVQIPRFRRVLDIARQVGTPNVRIFSFYLPKGEPPERYRDEVLRRMRALSELARQHMPEALLLHENEADIYGETPERCADIVRSVDAANMRAVFDPANFVIDHIQPYTQAYPVLEPYIAYVHVKDARMNDGQITPAGEGDGQLREAFAALQQRGYAGVLALEPHLTVAGRSSGFTGPERFHVAVQALRKVLASV